jgi:hypothetical protein
METRTILIANNKTQRRYNIETAATTLGELKAQMREQGIDYDGMTFTEGITKTQMVDDSSVLPTNVMYKGAPTNNLVMLLTNPNKQIASGAMDRKDAYRLVKEMNLQDAILEGEGTNYTRVKTDVLEEYININRNSVPQETLDEVREEIAQEFSTKKVKAAKTAPHADLVELLYLGVKYLVNHNILFAEDACVLGDLTTELSARTKEAQPKITDSDVDDMIANL